MPSFLFWNINNKPLAKNLASMARLYEVDVILLAECQIPPGELLLTLNDNGHGDYFYIEPIGCDRISIYSRYRSEYFPVCCDGSRFTIRRLCLPGQQEVLLVAAHLPSKLHFSNESQDSEIYQFANDIREIESQREHQRTILIGDLNVDPFAAGVSSAAGLHGVMCDRIAARGSRIVQAREYPFFYNPMWNLLGRRADGPLGTYYYEKAEHVVHYWHAFDQVLIRPALITGFDHDSLKILSSDGHNSLLTSEGAPDQQNYSDHLPLFFRCEFP